MDELLDKLDPHTRAEIKAKLSRASTKMFIADIWMEGYAAAVQDFSIWKDGRQTIGVGQLDPKQVIAEKRIEVIDVVND